MTRYLQQKTLFPPQIDNRVAPNLGMIVVIPCCDEETALLSLLSLKKCHLPKCSVEVIVVVNNSEKANSQLIQRNLDTFREISEWASKNSSPELKFHALYHPDLPHKHAGVGLARKIGMDEACWRLEKVKNPEGVIVCFDADSKCAANYFTAIEKQFADDVKLSACGIHFEHPLNGLEFDEEVYEAITLYELHLRYYVQAQRYALFPFAYQTIGSSMAVRCRDYQAQGGMNRRKAGEDFYFLHKFIELGTFSEIKNTSVIPSPRPSHRVPFGTGKAVGALLKSKLEYQTYALETFKDLRSFIGEIEKYYGLSAGETYDLLPESVSAFLKTVNFEAKWEELHKHTSDLESFQKRFFRWFNAFLLMKYVHFARDNYYPDVNVIEASSGLLEILGNPASDNATDLLEKFRALDLQNELDYSHL